MKKHYPVIIEQDKDGVYIVECHVLKSCRSYGITISEAIENIQEAIGACLLDEPPMVDDTTTFVGIRDLEMASL
jgi:predicted RNase H-like HicB family nuclease